MPLSGQWDTATAGSYSLLLDQWGASGASSGTDCAQLVTLSGTTLAWKTTWNWVGGTGVKSFTNIQLNSGLNKQLSAIRSIPVRCFAQSCLRVALILLLMNLICIGYLDVVSELYRYRRSRRCL